MSTTIQAFKTKTLLKTNSMRSSAISKKYLNMAFDGLNHCQLRTEWVPPELSAIISRCVDSGTAVYKKAHDLHLKGQYANSKKYCESVIHLCVLLNNLAEEQTDNILKLPVPPRMTLINSKSTAGNPNLHPSFSLLDSFIRRRMMKASKYYKSRLVNYSNVLNEISKHLKELKDYH